MKLQNELNKLNRYPFHMPGHKRNDKFGITGAEIDITEIDGFDNLHNAQGMLLDIENDLQSIYKSKKSFMLINGSTVGILASIFAICDEGDKIIIARNCHKSVYNACFMRKLRVVYIEPEFDYENGYYTRISQAKIDEITAQHSDAKAIVISSPSYEGNISSVKAHIPLIIDSAHGAHLGLGTFPAYPNGDIVISSLHKTLPALTQTAVLNVYNEEYTSKIKLYLDMLETSSPSYVLMNSIAICCDYIKNNKSDFNDFCGRLWDFRDIELDNLRLMYSDDFSKIIISTANTNISGTELADVLRKKYHIEPEMASVCYIILMTSVADDEDALNKLKTALIEIDTTLDYKKTKLIDKPATPNGINTIIFDNGVETSLVDSVGKRVCEFVYAYPPDIPILVPNEIITRDVIDYLIKMQEYGVNIISDSGLFPNKLLTKAD